MYFKNNKNMKCNISKESIINKCAEVAQQVHEDFINGKIYTPEMEEIKNKAIADGTFMKAPNGNPTNLDEKQWLQVRTKTFIKWFGDWTKITFDEYGKVLTIPDNCSKVVDENGEPLVVYHFSKNQFNNFSYDYIEDADSGFFFSSDRNYAKQYGTEEYPVFLSIKRPIDTDIPLHRNNITTIYREEFKKGDKNSDGIIGNDLLDDDLIPSEGWEIMAYRPNQIKSATDNTTFGLDTDNIYLQKGFTSARKLMSNLETGKLVHGRFVGANEKFIGTGEGMQAYGYGFYLGTAKSTAEWYAKMYNNNATAFIHTIEVPDNDGTNYIIWEKPIGAEIANKVIDGLKKMILTSEENKIYINEVIKNIEYKKDITGAVLYDSLCVMFHDIYHYDDENYKKNSNSAKATSKFLNSIGIIGNFHHINRGTPNIVIFDKKNIKIKDWNRVKIKGNKLEEYNPNILETIHDFIIDLLIRYNVKTIIKRPKEEDYIIYYKNEKEKSIIEENRLSKLFEKLGKEYIANEYLEKFLLPINNEIEEILSDIAKEYDFEIHESLGEVYGDNALGKMHFYNKVIELAKNRNAITLPEEFAHAFVKLMGQKISSKPKYAKQSKEYNELFHLVESTTIYKQVFDKYKDEKVYQYPNGTPNLGKIKEEAIGQAIAVALLNQHEKYTKKEDLTFLARIKDLVLQFCEYTASLLSKSAKFQKLTNDIAESIIDGTYKKKYLDKINTKDYKLTNYAETLKQQTEKDGGIALNLIKDFSSKGMVISGSLALKAQGTIYRKEEDNLHDIDIIVPENLSFFNTNNPWFKYETYFIDKDKKRNLTSDEYISIVENNSFFKLLKKEYPGIVFKTAFPSPINNNLIVQSFYTQNIDIQAKLEVYHGSANETFNSLTKEEQEQVYRLDFFLNPQNSFDIPTFTDNVNKINLAHYSIPFKAKVGQMAMNRAKDITDYQNYTPFDRILPIHENYDNLMYANGNISNDNNNSAIPENQKITSPIIDPENKTIQSSTAEESKTLEERLNRMFPLPNDSITERVDDRTVILKNIDDVITIYDFLYNNAINEISKQNIPSNTQNNISNYFKNRKFVDETYSKLRKILKDLKAKQSIMIDESLNQNLNQIQRNEIIQNYKMISQQIYKIENILQFDDSNNIDTIIENTDTLLDMYDNIFTILKEKATQDEEFKIITDPLIIFFLNKLFEIGENYFAYYESQNKNNDDEINKQIEKQRNRFFNIKDTKENFYKKLITNFFDSYNFKKDNDFKTGLNKNWIANLRRQIEKGLKDITTLDQMLFAFDNSFGENTVIGKIMGQMTDKVEIDSFNEAFDLSNKFDSLVLQLKEIGIDMTDINSYYDYFLEKLKDGTKTWKIKSFAKPEFNNILRSFYNIDINSNTITNDENDEKQLDKTLTILHDFDIINIFKLQIAHDKNSKLYQILHEFSSKIKKDQNGNPVIDPITGETIITSDWEEYVDNYDYDIEYEQKLKEKLGPEYEIMLKKYITLFYSTLQKYNLSNVLITDTLEEERNPYYILTNILKLKHDYKNNNSTNITYKGKNNLYYDYNIIPFIPNLDNNEYYDKSFEEMFSETNPNKDLMEETYNLLREIYSDKVGIMYFSDPYNRTIAMIKPENFADIISIIWNKKMPLKNKIIEMIKNTWNEFRKNFWQASKTKNDNSNINKNYIDEYNNSYKRTIELLKGFNKISDIIPLLNTFGLSRQILQNVDDVFEAKSIIAHKIAERDAEYTTDFVKATKNILNLYAIQKTNNTMASHMILMLNYFSRITTDGEKPSKTNIRTKAIEQFTDQLKRGFLNNNNDDIELSEPQKNFLETILNNISSNKTIDEQIDNIIKSNKKRFTKNEKQIISDIIKILHMQSQTKSFSFSYKNEKYEKKVKYRGGVEFFEYSKNGKKISTDDFNKARKDFFTDMILKIGSELNVDSVITGGLSLIRLKMLGGYVFATISGLKNRIDGLVATSDIDATNEYFTAGNLAKAQRFLMFGMLPIGLINKEGDIAFKNILSQKMYKRFKITKILGERLRIMQDMTNIFDKNIGNTRMGTLKTNANLYNASIQLPEIRNQYDIMIARLMDVRVKDKYGIFHKFISNNEFTIYNLDDNGNVTLKDDFNPELYDKESEEYKHTKDNLQWINFDTEIESKSINRQAKGKTDISNILKSTLDTKKANSRVNGDYRDKFKKMYTSTLIGKLIMNFKTYMPERFKRAWSSGNNDDTIGEFITLYDKGGAISMFTILYSSFNKDGKRILPRPITQSIEGIAGLGYFIHAIRTRKKNMQTMEKNMLERTCFDLLFLRQLLYEILLFLPRTVFKYSGNTVEFLNKSNLLKDDMFTISNDRIEVLLRESEFEGIDKEKYRKYLEKLSDTQRKQHIGNICSLARGVARQLYELPIKVAVYYLAKQLLKRLLDDDDDIEDPKEQELVMNTITLQLNNISESANLLYQVTAGTFDSYQNIVAIKQIDRTYKAIKGLENLEYEKNATKLAKILLPSVRLWQITSEYKGEEQLYQMISNQFEKENLDYENYQVKVFDKKYTKIRQKAVEGYMKAAEENMLPIEEEEIILKKFKHKDCYKTYKEKYDVTYLSVNDILKDNDYYEVIKDIIRQSLPQKNKKDMFGQSYKNMSSRDMIQIYQEWFEERKDWLKKPWGLSEYSRNPNWELDFIKFIQDKQDEIEYEDYE